MKDHRCEMVPASLTVAALTAPELIQVPLRSSVWQRPVVPSLPVARLVLIGTATVEFGNLVQWCNRDQIVACEFLALCATRDSVGHTSFHRPIRRIRHRHVLVSA